MRKSETSKLHKAIDENKGSTLITVIVAIAFVTILVSIILGTTVVNVRMKGIDRRTKDDFYYAERSLNDIYTGLGQELAVIAGDEYEKAFKKVGVVELSGEDFNMAETAEKDFRKNFMLKVKTAIDSLDEAALQDYVLASSKGTVERIGSKIYQKKNGETTTEPGEAYRVVIKDVEVSVTDSTGYRSVISTDIVITIPTVDFLGTNADVSDYGLIANEGLYINGDAKINGNVYAGTHEDERSEVGDAGFKERTDAYSREPLYGGINIKDGKAIFDGNYIISKGDINLAGNSPQIQVVSDAGADNLANLWFTSMRTISGATTPKIIVNANTFALNDMILNADNSDVVIQGNYYGYNEGSLPDIFWKKGGREDSENSAIIINGSKASLDMRDINNFVLMGKAYIDFTSDPDTNVAGMESGSYAQVVKTAEGVALKTNQQLYLAPPDFLDTPNPTTEGTGAFNVSVGESDLKNWFGYSYLAPSPTWKDIGTSYTVTMTDGTKAYYYYLKFNDDPDDPVNWKPTDVTSSVSTLPEDTDREKYIATTSDGIAYKVYKYEIDSAPVGTGGSISSQAMFFLKIMTSRSTYEYKFNHGGRSEDGGYANPDDYIDAKESAAGVIQPSAYRLWDRIKLSMDYDYFDLSKCVVGNSADPGNAHYYAKNAVINYERDPYENKIQSNVLNNTDGMGRYLGYSPNLYNRYVFLCTALDGKEDVLLDAPAESLGTPDMTEWKVDSTTPISHFVKLGNIGSMVVSNSITEANAEGLKPGAFGVCIAQNSDLEISTALGAAVPGNTFKGVAIVNGNITVDTNINVDGLLMATGTITLKGNNNINYNKGLIQSRIEKEMNIVKNKDAGVSDPYKNYYLINYLSKDDDLLYKVDAGSKIRRDRIEADYNDFVHYENWQKGEK